MHLCLLEITVLPTQFYSCTCSYLIRSSISVVPATASSRPNLQALQNTQHQLHEEKRTQKCHASSCILEHNFQTYIVTYLFVYYFHYRTMWARNHKMHSICTPKCQMYLLLITQNVFQSASMFKIWWPAL